MNRSDDRSGKRPQSQATPQSRQSRPPQPQSADASSRPGQRQQQQQGAGDPQHGEGDYQATRDYDSGLAEHLRTHDVEREARDAAPRSEEEAREMREAEELGKRKAGGMRDPKDRMDGSKDPNRG